MKSIKELWEIVQPSSQLAIISAIAMGFLGVLVGAFFVWLRPECWPWAVAAGGFAIQIGLSVMALRISARRKRN